MTIAILSNNEEAVVFPRGTLDMTSSPESTLAAAQLIACRPEAYPLESIADALQRLASHQTVAIRELLADRDACEADAVALRRHVRAMLKRLKAIHDRCRAALRPPQYGPAGKDDGTTYTDAQYAALSKAFREDFAEMAAEIDDELKGLGE